MIVESYEDVIVLSGALRSNFWETIHTAISLTLRRHPSGVIIDCSGITECTPEGADTFRDAMDFISRHQARVIVAAVPAPVMEVLRSVPEVRSQLAVAGSVEEARRSLDLLLIDEEDTKRKRPRTISPDQCRTRALVLLRGEASDRDALAEVLRLDDLAVCHAILAFVIVVPRHLPLQSPMPEAEAAAMKAIEPAQARFTEESISFETVIERGRDISSALNAVIERTGATQLIVPLGLDPERAEFDAALVKSLLEKVAIGLTFVRPKRTSG